jgi:hypothetical protein
MQLPCNLILGAYLPAVMDEACLKEKALNCAPLSDTLDMKNGAKT